MANTGSLKARAQRVLERAKVGQSVGHLRDTPGTVDVAVPPPVGHLRPAEIRHFGASGPVSHAYIPGTVGQWEVKRDTSWDTRGTLGADPFDTPQADHASEWRRWFALLVQHKKELRHSPIMAAQLAYGEALTAWHLQHGTKPDHGYCAGCGAPVAHPIHTLPDGAAVCPDDDCLIAYGQRWRAAAAAALTAMGINGPGGDR